jgi:Uma2 family endonuclease
MLTLQSEPKPAPAPAPARAFVPPLENGDQLHSREFLRRYDRMPLVKKAELIEGVVIMGSPVSRRHGRPDIIVHAWLEHYVSHTPGVEALANVTVVLDPENTVQPDCFLRILAAGKGRTGETEAGLITGPPELVVEIAASSASIDAHKKLGVYRRNGVLEYLLWRVDEERFDWLHLVDEEYVAAQPDAAGILRSRHFPGLQVSLPALLALDSARVLASLQEGLATPAHADYARTLTTQ